MAGDAVLTRDGPVTAPLDYTVPSAGEMIPRSVRATIDGTGAASSFYATLQVLSPSGRVMFSAVSSAIAAGGSADVSWFPHVGGSTQGTVLSGLMAARIEISVDQAIPAITNTLVNFDTLVFDTGTPSKFWNALTPTRLTAPADGLYMVQPTLIYDIDSNLTIEDLAMYLYRNGSAQALYKANSLPAGDISYTLLGFHLQTWALNAGEYFEINAYHQTAGNLNLKVIPAGGDHGEMRSTFTMIYLGPL